MAKNDLSQKTDAELFENVQTQREVVRAFRFSTAGSATRDVRAVRTARKEVARCLTELTRRARTKDTAQKIS